jgi:hypothetical protein
MFSCNAYPPFPAFSGGQAAAFAKLTDLTKGGELPWIPQDARSLRDHWASEAAPTDSGLLALQESRSGPALAWRTATRRASMASAPRTALLLWAQCERRGVRATALSARRGERWAHQLGRLRALHRRSTERPLMA